ncbi:MAG: hypothetical protein V1895_00715 [Parcubacteria group bacterium]
MKLATLVRLQPDPQRLSEQTIEELVEQCSELSEHHPRQLELSVPISEELYTRLRRKLLPMLGSWWSPTTKPVLLQFLRAQLAPVTDDWRNVVWVQLHGGLRSLIALVIIVCEPVPILRKRCAYGWITQEELARRIRNINRLASHRGALTKKVRKVFPLKVRRGKIKRVTTRAARRSV